MDCHFLLQGIFPTQESNAGLLHCRQMLYHLSHQGSTDQKKKKVALPPTKHQTPLLFTNMGDCFFIHYRFILALVCPPYRWDHWDAQCPKSSKYYSRFLLTFSYWNTSTVSYSVRSSSLQRKINPTCQLWVYSWWSLVEGHWHVPLPRMFPQIFAWLFPLVHSVLCSCIIFSGRSSLKRFTVPPSSFSLPLCWSFFFIALIAIWYYIIYLDNMFIACLSH